jgi:hypothetical protein
MLKEYNITVRQTNLKAMEMFSHEGNQNKLIVTFSLQNTIRKVKKTMQSYDRSHIQLSVLSEFDKPGIQRAKYGCILL